MKKMFFLIMVVACVLLSQGVFAIELNYDEQQITNDNGGQGSCISEVYLDGESDDGSQQTGSISGTVYGKKGWSIIPLVGATVTAGGRKTYTGFGGGYHLGNLPLGAYIVKASYPGYGSKSAVVVLTAENPHGSASFILEKSGGDDENVFLYNEYKIVSPN